MSFFADGLSEAELRRRVGHLSQLGGVRLLTSDNGPSRGVRLLEFRTGTGFGFEIGVDRGFDVGRCDYRGARCLAAADAAAGPVVFRGSGEFRLARRAGRLQQHLRPAAYRQSGRRRCQPL